MPTGAYNVVTYLPIHGVSRKDKAWCVMAK